MSPVPIELVQEGKGSKWYPTIIEFLEKNDKEAYSVDELAKEFGCSTATLREPLKRLVEIEQIGRGRVGRKFYYHTA